MSSPFHYRTKTQVDGTKLRVSIVHVEDLGWGREVESTIASHEIDTALMGVRGALLELGWSPPEKRPDPRPETTTVPVVLDFDHARPVGSISVRTDALPPDPGFVFVIGYQALGANPDVGPYSLVCASIARDEDYANYLRAKGKMQAMTANRETFQAELTRQYERLFKERPLEYAYAMKTHTPASLAEKMTTSLAAGTGSIQGEGIKRACKALGVKHTYRAVEAYLKGERS